MTFAEIERETDDLPSSLENISFYKLECFFEREFEINFNLTSTYLKWNAFEGRFKMQNIPNSVLSLATKTWYWTSEQASHAFLAFGEMGHGVGNMVNETMGKN